MNAEITSMPSDREGSSKRLHTQLTVLRARLIAMRTLAVLVCFFSLVLVIAAFDSP